ncbi:MAG: crossover junction endodeoxyribonuclease RuvC [Ignavibacteriaceae bacterium]|nr:crossover junction endodeoxyribonuclease RuvC [Ignavibacteriaceae bacterium]
MIIIGVDPGTVRCGYGLIRKSGSTVQYIDSGVINLSSADSVPFRLGIIYTRITEKIREYKPEFFALETAFFGKNVQSALKIGYARGAAMLAAVHHDLIVAEYSPREVKKAVTGNGGATKEQVSYMVRTILSDKEAEFRLDESDALAIAICHSFRAKSDEPNVRNWKDFIKNNPHLVKE